MEKAVTHQRVNDILLGPLERPALKWLAAHMPKWMTPDILTGIGVFASVLIFFSYWLTNYSSNFLWLASFGFLLNWFGDSLDGNLARFRRIERPRYGYFIDHTTDSVSEILICLGFGLSPYIRFDFALLVLLGYLLMSVLIYIITNVTGVFKISFSKFGPTEVRVLAILANTLIYFIGNPVISFPFGKLTVYDTLAISAAIILFLIFIVSVLTKAAEFAKMDKEQKKLELQEKQN